MARRWTLALLAAMLAMAAAQSSSSTGASNSSSISSSSGANILAPSITGSRAYDNFTFTPTARPPDFNASLCEWDYLLGQQSGIPLQVPSKADGTWKKWDVVPICIVFGGKYKVVYYPMVDEFALLEVALAQRTRATFDHHNMWFQVETPAALTNKGTISPTKRRREIIGSNQYDLVVPFWTIIIVLNQGKVKSITFDDGCYSCNANTHCLEQTCAVDITGCASAQGAGGNDCDPKLYVGWYGTDADGRYLTSSGKRLSRFRQFSAYTAFTTAANTAYGALPSSPQFTPTVGSNGQIGDNGDTTVGSNTDDAPLPLG